MVPLLASCILLVMAALNMREVRKSQRRHAALLSGVYPFGHPILVRL